MGSRMVTLLLAFGLVGVRSQSNYALQGNSIEYQPGLPPSTVLDGKVTKLDDIQPIIFLNRTKAYLNCGQGSMEVEMKFEEPFYGRAYADFDRNSACMVKGRGLDHATLELPLKGCGTKQDPQRVFTNNIVVRFHPGLEMDGDEVITIVCRYPPPVTPKTDTIGTGPYVANPPVLLPASEPPLKGFQILLTICALLFLSLLLLGLGCSYLCMKRRNVRVVHRQPFGSGTGSEITKLSGSSLGNISMFEGLKIPRAHALLHAAPSSSGSEVNLVIDHSDTLPSDYPSESHSEAGIEVDEVRSLPVSSAGSYENKAFLHHQSLTQQVEVRASSSIYSETTVDAETIASATASRITLPRHPVAVPAEQPKFDVQMRVKRAPPPPPSPLPSESDASIALERNLTTILEREEQSARSSMESPLHRMTTFSYVPELHGPPSGNTISRQQTPPVYSRILRKQAERENQTLETLLSSPNSGGSLHRPRSLTTLTEFTETEMLTEVTDSSHAKYRVANILAPTPPPPPPIAPTPSSTHVAIQHRELTRERENAEPLVEPIVSTRRPEITTHEVDDVFLRTVTEKKTIEDVERHRRQVTEYHARPKPQPDPKWDVTIRNYPTEELPPPPPEWENFSDVSSASNLTITNEPMTHRPPAMHQLDDDGTIHPTYNNRGDIPTRPGRGLLAPDDRDGAGSDYSRSGNNFFSLARVLEPQYATELTDDERRRWREIITSESTLRTLLTEAVVKEDYELIRKDARYTTLFPATKWDVIIRILSPPPGSTSSSSHWKGGQRYKRSKSSEWDSRSRRSSLPTLYEYESDGGSTLRSRDHSSRRPSDGLLASENAHHQMRRFSSTTRAGSETDLRSSMSEITRDFARVDDLTSLSSFEADSLVRSLSQPSLGRSASEFAAQWTHPQSRNLTGWSNNEDPSSSTETTPLAVRRGDRVEVMASFDTARQQNAGASGVMASFARSTRYTETENVRLADVPRSSWFHDDSEPEMQI